MVSKISCNPGDYVQTPEGAGTVVDTSTKQDGTGYAKVLLDWNAQDPGAEVFYDLDSLELKTAMNKFANQYVEKRGDKWVVTQKDTGKVLSTHDSQADAQASFEAMMAHKHGGRKIADGHDGPKFKVGDQVRTAPDSWSGSTGDWKARGTITKVDKNTYGYGEAPEYMYTVDWTDANADLEDVRSYGPQRDISENLLVLGSRKISCNVGDRIKDKNGNEGKIISSDQTPPNADNVMVQWDGDNERTDWVPKDWLTVTSNRKTADMYDDRMALNSLVQAWVETDGKVTNSMGWDLWTLAEAIADVLGRNPEDILDEVSAEMGAGLIGSQVAAIYKHGSRKTADQYLQDPTATSPVSEEHYYEENPPVFPNGIPPSKDKMLEDAQNAEDMKESTEKVAWRGRPYELLKFERGDGMAELFCMSSGQFLEAPNTELQKIVG